MGWTTIYITGKGDFREEVRDRLEDSSLNFMPGSTGITPEHEIHDLFWVNEKVTLREFKEAIGSKLIWKYRLRFYPSFEAYLETQNKKSTSVTLTKEDLALLDEIKASIRLSA